MKKLVRSSVSVATGIPEDPLVAGCVNSIIFLSNLKQNRNFKRFANGKISEMGIARIPGASNASAILTPWWKPAAQREALNIAGRPILNTYGRIFNKSSIIRRDGLACFIYHPICSSLQHYQPPCKLQDMSSGRS
jgi:hypothetical protein